MPQLDHDNFKKIIVVQTNVHYVLRCNAETLSCDFFIFGSESGAHGSAVADYSPLA